MNHASYCNHCHRPQSRCLCRLITPINNPFHVFILQHSKERHHPKGTAQLAHLCLAESTLICDKNFETALNTILSKCDPVLLYPEQTEQQSPLNLSPKTFIPQKTSSKAKKPALIVLDGTWKKANKIYHTHPMLHGLPRCHLDRYINQYTHRKSPSDQHLSTLEAICYGLQQLEDKHNISQKTDYNPLLQAQQAMIEHWQQRVSQHQPETPSQ